MCLIKPALWNMRWSSILSIFQSIRAMETRIKFWRAIGLPWTYLYEVCYIFFVPIDYTVKFILKKISLERFSATRACLPFYSHLISARDLKNLFSVVNIKHHGLNNNCKAWSRQFLLATPGFFNAVKNTTAWTIELLLI